MADQSQDKSAIGSKTTVSTEKANYEVQLWFNPTMRQGAARNLQLAKLAYKGAVVRQYEPSTAYASQKYRSETQ